MTREIIITELRKRGYQVKEYDAVKNRVKLHGIILDTKTGLSPIVYMEDIMKYSTNLEDAVDAIIKIYEKNKRPDFDLHMLQDKGFINSHLFIALQRKSDEDILKREIFLEDIESYVLIRDDRKGFSVKINRLFLESISMTEEEVWQVAERNTLAESQIINMASFFFGYGYAPMYILTNKSKNRGASAILNKELLFAIGKKFDDDKLVAIPSSIHEFIVLPYKMVNETTDELSTFIQAVNLAEVEEQEWLGNKAYIIDLKEMNTNEN